MYPIRLLAKLGVKELISAYSEAIFLTFSDHFSRIQSPMPPAHSTRPILSVPVRHSCCGSCFAIITNPLIPPSRAHLRSPGDPESRRAIKCSFRPHHLPRLPPLRASLRCIQQTRPQSRPTFRVRARPERCLWHTPSYALSSIYPPPSNFSFSPSPRSYAKANSLEN